jgi:hypothetical protein
LENNIINKLKPYTSEQYSSGVTIAKLSAVAIYHMDEKNIPTNFENVVVSLQRLFPGKFSLLQYPDIPDTMRIDNTLRLDAQNHAQYIKGNRRKGYQLTGLGKSAAEETIELLQSGIPSSSKPRVAKFRKQETQLVSDVMNSSAFEKFSTKQFSSINKFEICDVLHGTLETNRKDLHRNLQTLMGHAKSMKPIQEYEKLAMSVLEFLEYVEENWETLVQ